MVGWVGLQVAQAVLVPFLVDRRNLTQMSLRAVQAMMAMQPPSSFQVRIRLYFRPWPDIVLLENAA